jgi:hypothetical protein
MDGLSILGTLLSGVGGGALRLAPEILKYFDQKNERAHELALQDKQIELAKLQQAGKLQEIAAQGEAQVAVGQMDAFIAAVKGQMQLTGNKIVDGLNMLVRPLTTYYIMGMWGLKKTAEIIIAARSTGALDALIHTWTEADQAMLSGVLAFWFVGRVFDKARE